MANDDGIVVIAFIDTNILLHYPAIGDIDWCTLCKASKVTVMICMQVIHELDDKKSHTRLAERAGKRIKEIKQVRTGEISLNNGVSLDIDVYDPRDSDFPESLNPTSKDDRIVQSVLHFIAKNPSEKVVVITEDMGMQMKCKSHQLAYIEPPEGQRLPNPQGEMDKKYRKAVTELNDLKNRQPEVIFSILHSKDSETPKQPLKFSLVESVQDIERKMEFEKYEHRPDLNDATTRCLETGKTTISLKDRFLKIPEEEQKEYLDSVEQYLLIYKDWLIENHEFEKGWQARQIQFWIEIENIGKSPDKDVDLYLDLPPIFSFISSEYDQKGAQPEKPIRPTPPKPFVPNSFGFSRSANMLQQVQSMMSPAPHIPIKHFFKGASFDDIDGNEEEGYTIIIFHPKLNQHKRRTWGPYTLVFKSWDQVKTFNIETRLFSAGAPNKKEGKIPVIIKYG